MARLHTGVQLALNGLVSPDWPYLKYVNSIHYLGRATKEDIQKLMQNAHH